MRGSEKAKRRKSEIDILEDLFIVKII